MVKQQRNPARPPDSAMNASRHYDQGYHSEVHANLIASETYFKAVAETSQSLYLKPSERGSRILDYGCGIGQLIYGLPHAAGFEVSAEARSHCERRGLQVWSSEALIPRAVWDVVVVRHVLEHLESPLDALRQIRPLLAAGGTLLVVLPRERQAAAPLEPDIHQHLFCWNFRSLNNLLARAGYRPETNHVQYVRGFGALLPLYRAGAPVLYRVGVQVAGWLVGNSELVVRARLLNPEPDR